MACFFPSQNVNDITFQKNEANEIKDACESRVKSLLRENEELRQRIQQLEAKITELHQKINELNEDNDRTKERLRRTEVRKVKYNQADMFY